MFADSNPISNKEFSFSRRNFDQVVELINRFAGINLSERKVDMVYSRLARRIRALGLSDFDEYLSFVSDSKHEQVNFINSLTTNLTHFFRENHHFDYLRDDYFPELFSKNNKRIRCWSAGCSTGEEPYSLSMLWQEQPNKPPGIDFKILATDLDTNVLEVCKKGVYSDEKLKPVEKNYLKWFKQTSICKQNEWRIFPGLKKYTYFKQLNLMDEWPMRGPLDLIICRNVLIYFDKPTQQKLVRRFAELLTDDGCLILGHSENLSANKTVFNALGKTIYRKVIR